MLEGRYNLAEVGKVLKVSRRTLLKYIKEGQLDASKVGGKWLVRREALDRLEHPANGEGKASASSGGDGGSMRLRFLDDAHRGFYEERLKGVREGDVYRKALFYTLGVCHETRVHISDLYDFDDEHIKPEGIRKPWQTSESKRATRLAFNLYGLNPDPLVEGLEGESTGDWTPNSIFAGHCAQFFIEAVKLRHFSSF
jgi:excisionase family DNA binding protein